MKTIVTILLIAAAFCAKAQDSSSAYKRYVDSELTRCHQPTIHRIAKADSAVIKPYLIPRYQIPKGSVFCIMEYKLNRATKVWIKVGTNNNK